MEKIKVYGYIHSRILFSHKEGEILPFVTIQVDLMEHVKLSKINQMERDKYYMILLM